jgi:VCBS repeat-containing protein
MKIRILRTFFTFLLILTFAGPVFPGSARAVALGSGNCASTYTQTSGTFTATATESSGNCIVIFKTVADNSSSAVGTWTLPAGTYSVQYLVVGGGGSSSRGTCSYYWGSGGGGGEVLTGTSSLSGTVNVTVGKGGVNKTGNCNSSTPPPNGTAGVNSILASFTARAGSGGTYGANGGASGNLNSAGTGNGGVSGCPSPTYCNAGGGGGAGSSGSGMNAGSGISSNLSGTSTIYGAGGAGRGDAGFGTSETTCAGTSSRADAVMHTGCGGTDAGSAMGSGGSGIVIAVYAFDSTAPSFTNSTTFSFSENSATSTNAATITVNESSTITINSGSDSTLFSVVFSDSQTARIRFLVSPNFESPGDAGGNNIYDLSIRATDFYGNISNQSIAITVTNINEAPTITTNSSATTHSVTQAENISAVITYAATDVDAGTSLSWSLSGTDAADFSIAGSGALSFASNPDYEAPADSDANNSYIVVVTVSDGSLTDTQTITITITNANENASVNAPTISGTVYKGVTSTITVTINVSGKVRFYVGGKRISTCKDSVTSGTYPNNSATCLWKPAVTGKQILTATLTPTDNTFAASTSAPTEVFVRKRGTVR